MKTWQEFFQEMELKGVKKVLVNPQTGLAPVFTPQGPSKVVRPIHPLSKKLCNKRPTRPASAHLVPKPKSS